MAKKSAEQKNPDSGILNSLYMKIQRTASAVSRLALLDKIPALPLLDRQGTALLLFCALLYFIFVAYVFFTSPLTISQDFYEQPLEKNSALQLVAEETYRYEISSPDGGETVTYSTSRSSSCTGLLVSEEPYGNSVCLTQSGNLAQAGAEAFNSSYGNQSILLFAPWMLAVSDGFKWGFESRITAGSTAISFPVALASKGRKTIAGREAYEISVSSSGSLPSLFYIDAQKRVLISADSENVTVRLVSAPFPLNWSNSSAQN